MMNETSCSTRKSEQPGEIVHVFPTRARIPAILNACAALCNCIRSRSRCSGDLRRFARTRVRSTSPLVDLDDGIRGQMLFRGFHTGTKVRHFLHKCESVPRNKRGLDHCRSCCSADGLSSAASVIDLGESGRVQISPFRTISVQATK